MRNSSVRQVSPAWRMAPVMWLSTFLFVAGAQGTALDEPPAEEEARGEAEAEQDRPLSLDELLGLPQDNAAGSSAAERAAQREAEEALRRRLEEGERMANAFAEAIEQMTLSADLLDRDFDPGVGTQRIQEDVIAKLTNLIEAAANQPSPSRSRQERAQQQQQQPSPGPQQQSHEQGQPQNQRRTGEPQEGETPSRQEGDINAVIEETRTEWGALPERIREMLLQGRNERFSSLYDQLTREYYRRLASDE